MWQVITFDVPVYRFNRDAIAPAKVTLETGCYLREADTNQFAAFTLSRLLRPSGPTQFFETQRHEDVNLGVIGQYRFVAVGGLPGSGEIQIAVVKFRNRYRAGPFGRFNETGIGWTVKVKGVVYSHDSAIGDTPMDVATWFLNNIPNLNDIGVALAASGLPDLVFSGTRTGMAFGLEANPPPRGANQPFEATASIVQVATQDQRDISSQLTGAAILESDPIYRANYYLDGMMLKYQIKAVQTVEYNTVMVIGCDGAISQVSWEVGDGKPVRTVASVNCEHSDYVPPYPLRRRAENLPPAMPQNVGIGRDGGVGGGGVVGGGAIEGAARQ